MPVLVLDQPNIFKQVYLLTLTSKTKSKPQRWTWRCVRCSRHRILPGNRHVDQMLKAIFPFCHPKCRIFPKRSTGPVDDFLQKNRWSANFFLKPKALKPGNIECHPFSRGIKLDANVAFWSFWGIFFWRVHSFGFVIFLEDGHPPRYRFKWFPDHERAINEAIKLGLMTDLLAELLWKFQFPMNFRWWGLCLLCSMCSSSFHSGFGDSSFSQESFRGKKVGGCCRLK